MKALVLASGGIDSATCLALAAKRFGTENVIALAFEYGQKHAKEIQSAKKVADWYGAEFLRINLAQIFSFDACCSLLAASSEDIPRETYSEQLKKTNGKPVSTYVPFRNGLFLSCAASVALSKQCAVVYYGAHADDAAGNAYPDCSEAFNAAIGEAVYAGSGEQVRIEAPFISMNKAGVVKLGLELDAPYELTWSCYQGGEEPCGVCGTCRDRAAAFAANGAQDPALAVRAK